MQRFCLSWWRVLLAGLAVLLPLVPLVFALSITAGGDIAGASQGRLELKAVAASQTPTTLRQTKITAPSIPAGPVALVAYVPRAVPMYDRPDGRRIGTLPSVTSFGSHVFVWAPERRPGWLGVVTPQVGNGRLAWLRQRGLELWRDNWELRVSLTGRRLSVIDSGRTVKQFTIAVGAPASPTPVGRFAITDLLQTGDPSGPYGCCIVALSAEAPHPIEDWTGGNRVAIHSTPETWSIGQAVSHGCMRLTLAEGQWLLKHVPLGTPVLISSA